MNISNMDPQFFYHETVEGNVNGSFVKVITSRWQCAKTTNECSKNKEVWIYTNGEIIYPITTNFHPIGNKNFTSTQTLVVPERTCA